MSYTHNSNQSKSNNIQTFIFETKSQIPTLLSKEQKKTTVSLEESGMERTEREEEKGGGGWRICLWKSINKFYENSL